MRVVWAVMLISLPLLHSTGGAAALHCYKCTYVKAVSAGGRRQALGSTDSCLDPTLYTTGYNVTCFNDGDMCGVVFGSATGTLPVVGDLDLSVVVRDCFASAIVGCHVKGAVREEVRRVVNTALWLSTAGLNFQLSDLEYCSCDRDLCDPKCTVNDGLLLQGICVRYRTIVFAGVVALLVAVLCKILFKK